MISDVVFEIGRSGLAIWEWHSSILHNGKKNHSKTRSACQTQQISLSYAKVSLCSRIITLTFSPAG